MQDPRYKTAKILITDGHITALRELFDQQVIPKSVIAHDLGINNVRFTELIFHVDRFTYKDSFQMAKLIGINEHTIAALIAEQFLQDQKTKKKKPK